MKINLFFELCPFIFVIRNHPGKVSIFWDQKFRFLKMEEYKLISLRDYVT